MSNSQTQPEPSKLTPEELARRKNLMDTFQNSISEQLTLVATLGIQTVTSSINKPAQNIDEFVNKNLQFVGDIPEQEQLLIETVYKEVISTLPPWQRELLFAINKPTIFGTREYFINELDKERFKKPTTIGLYNPEEDISYIVAETRGELHYIYDSINTVTHEDGHRTDLIRHRNSYWTNLSQSWQQAIDLEEKDGWKDFDVLSKARIKYMVDPRIAIYGGHGEISGLHGLNYDLPVSEFLKQYKISAVHPLEAFAQISSIYTKLYQVSGGDINFTNSVLSNAYPHLFEVYKTQFIPYAEAITKHLKNGGLNIFLFENEAEFIKNSSILEIPKIQFQSNFDRASFVIQIPYDVDKNRIIDFLKSHKIEVEPIEFSLGQAILFKDSAQAGKFYNLQKRSAFFDKIFIEKNSLKNPSLISNNTEIEKQSINTDEATNKLDVSKLDLHQKAFSSINSAIIKLGRIGMTLLPMAKEINSDITTENKSGKKALNVSEDITRHGANLIIGGVCAETAIESGGIGSFFTTPIGGAIIGAIGGSMCYIASDELIKSSNNHLTGKDYGNLKSNAPEQIKSGNIDTSYKK